MDLRIEHIFREEMSGDIFFKNERGIFGVRPT